jgi:hypothetical protein
MKESSLDIDLNVVRRVINPPRRITGLDHLQDLVNSPDCHSVVEQKFYEDVVPLFERIEESRVPGDILVAGVWRGGSSLYLQALNLLLELNKKIWLSDTFSGFVEESITHEKDRQAFQLFTQTLKFAANFPTPGDVERLFRSCNLWNSDVTILEGPLEKTLLHPSIESLSLLHIDVDFYEPTRAALELAYRKLSPGGYVIIDDYGVDMFNCKDAVDDFRAANGITEPKYFMTDYIVYWRKERHVRCPDSSAFLPQAGT